MTVGHVDLAAAQVPVTLTQPEVAEILGISPWMVRGLVRNGELKTIPHTGRRVLVARAELERFIAAGVTS